jgi:hypothetical protein
MLWKTVNKDLTFWLARYDRSGEARKHALNIWSIQYVISEANLQVEARGQTLCHTPWDGAFHWDVITSRRDPSRVVKLPSPTAVRRPKAASCSTRRRFRGHNSMGEGSRFSASSYSLSKKADPGPPASIRRFQSSAGGCNSSSRMSNPAASAPRGRGKFCHYQSHKLLSDLLA